MTNTTSRRRWLLSAAITLSAGSLSPRSLSPGSLSAEPTPPVASSSLPVPSRSIRLGGPGQAHRVVTAIAADPRGEFIAAAGDDFDIRILRTTNLSTAATLRAHRDVIRTLAFDPSGRTLASAGNDGRLMLWDREDSFRIRQKMQGTPALACVRFSADGSQMAAVGFDNELFLIGRGRQAKPVFRCDCTDLRSVAYRDDNRILAVGGRSGDLHLFDLEAGRMRDEHDLHRARIHGIAFHRQSNHVVCVAEDGNVTVLDTEGGRLVHRIKVTSGKLFAVAVLNSQLVAVAGSDNFIRIVNTDDGVVTSRLRGHTGSVSTLAASGGLLFSGSYDATLRRWSLANIEQGQRIAEGDSDGEGNLGIER